MMFQLTYKNRKTGQKTVLDIYARNVDEAKYQARQQLGNDYEFVTVSVL